MKLGEQAKVIIRVKTWTTWN